MLLKFYGLLLKIGDVFHLAPQNRITIKNQFQTKRSRLLYFIYQKRKIKNHAGIKSKLAKAFEYKSDGHFYHDFNYLVNSGLLEENGDYLRITKTGRSEFRLLGTMRFAILITLLFGFYYFIAPITFLSSFPIVFNLYIYFASVIFFTVAILCYFTFKTFRPRPPSDEEILKVSS